MYYTTMKDFVTRKQSLEEEIQICQFLLSVEHSREIKGKIQRYLEQINRELIESLR